MGLSQAFAAVVIAGACGTLGGLNLSVAGWAAGSALLLLTLVLFAFAGGMDLAGSTAVIVLSVLGFNAGLLAGIIPRTRLALREV